MSGPGRSELRIRMYNVGFGDCFLLTLPDKKVMLVDCGFHSQGKGAFTTAELTAQIVADVTDVVGATRIDVIVATHRHQDHVFGFNVAGWDEVSVGEVWMPWVEDRRNVKARKLWKKQHSFALQLFGALPNFGLSGADRKEAEFLLWNAGVDEVVGDIGFGVFSNRAALDRLIEGFGSRDRALPRFLPETDALPEAFESEALPGVIVHVLGPPRNAELLAKLDPEQDGETYRALTLRQADLKNETLPAPFGSEWFADPNKVADVDLDSTELERLAGLARSVDALFAAQALDDMINATSLVLAIQIGNARLLLPGDAEWGTWKQILASDEARALLHGSTFLKVGHHGSYNATPKTLVEQLLAARIPAMISTQQGEGRYRNNIPLPDLLDALAAHRVRVVRSDVPPDELPEGFVRGPDNKWIDLLLPC